jgi:hypothetical protein
MTGAGLASGLAVVDALSPEVVRAVNQAAAAPDVVFDALDGRDCATDSGLCRVEIYGIYDDGRHRWLQLALNGQMLTVRADGDQTDWALISLASAA